MQGHTKINCISMYLQQTMWKWNLKIPFTSEEILKNKPKKYELDLNIENYDALLRQIKDLN